MKIVIIGGVAGGATVAARLRRLSETNQIIIIERDKYISYANCGLPYYIGDVIREKEKLLVQTVVGMSKRFNLDIRNLSEVTLIDKANKTVKIKKLESGEVYEESYDKLILSCGAKPIKPNILGLDKASNVFTLRNIADTYQIKDFVTLNHIKTATVIGGGFIGVEMAENLTLLGVNVTLVEKMPQVLKTLDFEMAQIVHQELNTNGVELILNDGISEFSNNGNAIKLESGKELLTDMTVLAIGVTPENYLAKSCNFKLGARGYIVTTDTFNTIDNATEEKNEDIFAIGDMIEVTDFLDGTNTAIPLAWGANRQARLLADHINGLKIRPSKIQGTSVIKVFGLTVAGTGANEAALNQKGIKYIALNAHRANHASYYPNSSNIALKLLFDEKSGKIFGAQAVGGDGTEKRIDVLATTMRLGGTVAELSDLELSYAPPYSTAKDPVNILGYISENIMDGAYKLVHASEIDDILKNKGYLIDVRMPFEFNNGHIAGAVNIELDTLRQNLDKITVSKDAPICLNCQVGFRSYLAICILKANGYTNLFNLSGGYTTYKQYKYQLNAKKTAKKEVNKIDNTKTSDEIKELDVTGIQCPGPLMATYKALNSMTVGEQLRIKASDCGFSADIESWCATNGHTLLSNNAENGKYIALIKKGEANKCNLALGGNQQK